MLICTYALREENTLSHFGAAFSIALNGNKRLKTSLMAMHKILMLEGTAESASSLTCVLFISSTVLFML